MNNNYYKRGWLDGYNNHPIQIIYSKDIAPEEIRDYYNGMNDGRKDLVKAEQNKTYPISDEEE